eukprot:scaffold133446_cov63-Phaeocystis_antarctica.AAC.2
MVKVPARLLRLLGARLAALGSSVLPERAGPLGSPPLPRMHELAASKVAHFTAFDHVGMNASRGLWTNQPLPAEVRMYSAVDPLMCMVIFMQLRDLWFGRSAPDAPIDASLLASRMANVADGFDFLRDT